MKHLRNTALVLAVSVALFLGAVGLSTHAQGPASATGAVAVSLTGQGANIAATPISSGLDPVLWTRGGIYRASCYVITTTAATTSSTLPACNVVYTDGDTGNVHTAALTATSAANALDTVGAGTTTLPWGTFNAKASTAISYSTSSYATSGATAMAYSVYFRLEYVGK